MFKNMKDLVEQARERGLSLGDVMIAQEMEEHGQDPDAIPARMAGQYQVMKQSARRGLEGGEVRLVFPPLTEDRRKDLVKLARKMTEEARVAMRNIRRDALDSLKKLDGAPEDEVKRAQEDIQKMTDRHIDEIGKALVAKEKEIMEV